ncbi:DUF5995 family protein [Plantactinospora sp. GCM10030261]|uniref:DUF5995 family protein n=1 Tax=Plantactinospora sp. GCM10030261 TaxID=3273420 RepID=UPI00361EB044
MHDGIARIVARMEAGLNELDTGDARRFFHETYLRTTRAVVDEIDRGRFADSAWLRRWNVEFAELYLTAFVADQRGTPVPGPWRVAFDTARQRPDLPPLRHVLLGMNAHINYDLPQSLIAVISPAEFADPEVRRTRREDHTRVDAVLLRRITDEQVRLSGTGRVTVTDRSLAPLNRLATARLLTEARAKVWRNVDVLDRARRDGPGRYAAALRHLDAAATAKLTELTAPGQVLLRLARRGFGVLLPEA